MSSMDFDFFTIDGLEEDIKKTLKQLNKMEKAFKDEACRKAVEAAAPILLEEEKQQLQRVKNYGSFKNLNSSWLKSKLFQYANGHWIAQCGYPTEVIKKHPEVVIVEFGRPGHGKKSEKIKEIQKDVKFFKTLTVIWLILFVVGLCVLIFNPVLDIFNSALK